MYIMYYPDSDEYEVKGKIYKIFTNEKLYKNFLELYDYIEYDDNIYGAFIIENKKKKNFSFGRVFYVEKIENTDIIDNDEKLLNLYKEL